MENYQYCTPQQVVASGRYPFSLAQLRHFLLFRHRNGLRNVVRKVGKRLVLRMDLFEAWIESQNEGENA